MFPAGRETYSVNQCVNAFRGKKATHLVGGKAGLAIDSHLKDRVCLFDTDDRRTSQVPVWIVAMAECQAVNAPVTLVVRCAIV